MRLGALIVGGVFLTGCHANEGGLSFIEHELERTLAEKQEIAQHLNEVRRQQDILEQRVAEVLARLPPGTDAGFEELEQGAPTPPRPPLVPPPVSFFEGSGAERQRERIR